MKQRERFGSRLGFILVSAGCAVGLGNVYKFPYMCGQYGGAAFIVIYLAFLVLLGIPIMVCEFAIGRGSQKSAIRSFHVLEPAGSKWHRLRWIGVLGCYLLMMSYTMIAGWMLYYCYRTATGAFVGASPEQINTAFTDMLANPGVMMFWTLVVIVGCFAACLVGFQKGVERVSKFMMVCLFLLMGALIIHTVQLPGAIEGIKFYLIPNLDLVKQNGLGNIVFGAMNQAFFTLSLGIGAMVIFGSYLDKKRSLAGEAISICALDTLVALMAGFIVIPSCFAFGIEPNSGASLVLITLPNVFANIAGGQFWGALFFLFLSFAALTTIIAVFENIVSFAVDQLGWSRKKSVYVNMIALIILTIPAVLGYNLLSGFQPLGAGSTIADLEDFLVSNNLLPLGSVVYLLFCVRRNGWGWDNFIREANAGEGAKLPNARFYMSWILPIAVVIIYIKGYYDLFKPKGTSLLVTWMCLAVVFLIWIGSIVFYRQKQK